MKIFIDGIEYGPKSSPEKKIKRDWEIIKFSNSEKNFFWELNDSGTYQNSIGSVWPLDELLYDDVGHSVKNGKIIIHSVIRISDNCIFSIGDSVDIRIGAFNTGMGGDGWQRFTSEITKFNIFHDEIFIECGSCSGSLKEAICLKEYASKLPERTKLFTTEDGVDKHPGDDCIIVDLKTLKISGWYNLPKNLNNLS